LFASFGSGLQGADVLVEAFGQGVTGVVALNALAGLHKEVQVPLGNQGIVLGDSLVKGEQIGQGGYGKVYKATHRESKATRAIKKIKKNLMKLNTLMVDNYFFLVLNSNDICA
jgi:hypothetical protein